jgi:succinoglycan biosynthesis transport protein ExoP
MELFVSFSEIMEYFKRNLLKFIVVVAVFGIVFGLMPLKFVHNQYESDTTIVLSCEIPETAQTDYRLQYTSILNSRVQTAAAMASGHDMIQQVAKRMQIDDKLITSINAVQAGTGPVVKITVNSPVADKVEEMTNTAAEILSEKLASTFPSPKISLIVSDKAIAPAPQSMRSTMVKAGILGLIFGFIVSVCYGIIVVLMDKTIRNSHYVSEALKTNLLGTVPLKSAEQKKQKCFRVLRAAAVTQAADGKSFLITDVCEQNGASAVALGFANALAASGKNVLLMDIDFHTKALTSLLGISPKKHLADILSGECSAEQAICQTQTSGLSFLSGTSNQASNSADILFSARFEELMKEFSQKFDYIVGYVPSEVNYADADNAAKLFDFVVMTVKYGSTPYPEFKDSFHRLGTVGGRVIGFVTTDV